MKPAALMALTLLACGPKAAPDGLRAMPDALPETPFKLPAVEEGKLSNGVVVRVVRNDEVPLFTLSLLLRAGSWTDPKGQEGLSSAAFDLATYGAGARDAAAIAAALKQTGGSVSASAGMNGSGVYASGPTSKLDPILDLWADVLLRPTFPADEWARLRDRRIANLRADADKPDVISARASSKLMWGDRYAGRHTTEASYKAIEVGHLKAQHQKLIAAKNAMILVGGDVTLAEILPKLEARLKDWPLGEAITAPDAQPQPRGTARVYFIDKPGAAQSVISAQLPLGLPTDPDHWALYMGNTVLGGAFTARLNMNLREDKGYTYGARCRIGTGYGPETWTCSASVNTPVTGPAMVELKKEIEEIQALRPITNDEIGFFRGYHVHSFQGRFETPSALLGELGGNWLIGLPDDWIERFVPGVQGVAAADANSAVRNQLRPDQVTYLVVGDKSKVFADLGGLGLPVIELDRDGNPLETP